MSKKATTVEKDTKTALIEAGIQIMFEKGYTNTGIQEVLQATGVPKGSFYHHFDSKEDFGVAIISAFEAEYIKKLDMYLGDKTLSPVARMRRYCDESRAYFESQKCRKGCLIGNLSQEMSDQSEVLRARLEEVMTRWRNRFAQCITEAQKAGEIAADFDHVQLAEFFLSGWEGSIMRAKTTKTTLPQQAFITIMFERLLNCGK